MRNIIFVILLSPLSAHAGWFCSEESSEKNGNVINACGVGVGSDENEARTQAFENAKLEYKQLCEGSDDCRYHFVNIKPKRTECSSTSQGFKCYRMLAFEIGGYSLEKANEFHMPKRGHVKTMGESFALFKVN